MDIQNAHLAGLDDLHHRLRLAPVDVVLVLAKLNELVAHDVQTHLLLQDEVEVSVVIIAVRLTGSVWERERERERETEGERERERHKEKDRRRKRKTEGERERERVGEKERAQTLEEYSEKTAQQETHGPSHPRISRDIPPASRFLDSTYQCLVHLIRKNIK